MIGDDDQPPDGQRTVVAPAGGTPPDPLAVAGGEGRLPAWTVFSPSLPVGEMGAIPAAPTPGPSPGSGPANLTPTGAIPAAPAPPPELTLSEGDSTAAEARGRIAPGMVLNGIFEVKRKIARGGMGEVYEGVNIHDDQDRVAIKVMLPQLAHDPNVQSMFRKEARMLTRLSHPTLVHYRVLAADPMLGLYMVMEFVSGPSIADTLGQLHPAAEELRAFIRRMATGLKAAHDVGAVHRDLTPANILLPDGRLDQAKIIDFGIAKDMGPDKATIIGDGFAGTLGNVAPEQLGSYGGHVGPWSDVYSLGLIIVSIVRGRPVDMGATFADALDLRRAGVDVSAVPAELQPIVTKMLMPDPADRYRSMDDLLAALDQAPAAPAALGRPAKPEPKPKPPPTVKPPKAERPNRARPAQPPQTAAGGTRRDRPRRRSDPAMLYGMIGVAALVVICGFAVVLNLLVPSDQAELRPRQPAHVDTAPVGPPSAPAVSPDEAAPVAPPQAELARRSVAAALATANCSWLNLDSAEDSGNGVSMHVSGASGTPTEAQRVVTEAANGSGAAISEIALDQVFQINHRVCSLVDAIRPFRADTSAQQAQLRTTQRTYQMERQDDDSIQARALITVSPSDAGGEIALLGVDTSGRLNAVFASRAQLAALIANPRSAGSIAGVGPNAWRFTIYDNDAPGPRGILLITSRTPVDVPLLTTSVGSRSHAWTRRVADAAQAGGWRSEMVWYTTERSSIPPTPPMPAGAAPPTAAATAQHPAPPERPGRR